MKMRSNKKLIVAVGLALGMAGSAWANVPPPPVNQNIGINDTVFNNLHEQDCRFCHRNDGTAPNGVPVKTTYLPDRHHALVGRTVPNPTAAPNPSVGNGKYECLTCHTLVKSGTTYVFAPFRDCLLCHQQNAQSPVTVHHKTTYAQQGACARCHGFIVDLTTPANKRVAVPTYKGSLVTPWPSGKTNGAPADPNDPTVAKGNAGNCDYCHNSAPNNTDPPVAGTLEGQSGVRVYTNATTHHSTGLGTQTDKCAWCHDTAAPANQRVRACENCHDIGTLHNIQVDSNANGITPGAEDAYYGHVGQQKDCWGCHGFALQADSGSAGGAIIPSVDGVDASADLVEGRTVTLIVNGAGFINMVANPMTGDFESSMESQVEITDPAGNTTTLTPTAITEDRIEVNVTLAAAGNYELRVVKGDYKSNPVVITVADAVTANSVTCLGNVVTIKGSGFSRYVKATDSGTSLTAQDASGNTLNCKINSWRDATITATCNACPSTVTVNSIWGSASKQAPRVRARR